MAMIFLATVGPFPFPGSSVGASAPPLSAGSSAESGWATPPADSWVYHSPAACANQHPAMVYPLRPSELEENLACTFRAGVPVPPARHAPIPGRARGGGSPPGFGLFNLQMTYDAADGYLLLFGATGSGPHNGTETWSFRGGNWTELHPVASPVSCLGSAMAYDPFDGYVLYLGGGNLSPSQKCPSANQTWAFRSGNWTQLHPTVTPPARQAAALTNDSRDGYMLLFGGACDIQKTIGLCGGTWSFVGGNWTNVSHGPQPWPRAGAGMTYDASDGYVLMFGGDYWPPYQLFPIMLADTWTYAGGNWTQLGGCGGVNQPACPSNDPPEPWPDGMTYDAASGVVDYTCARENLTGGPENYYTFHAGNWTNLNRWFPAPGTVPPNRLGEGLVYDYADGFTVLFGGVDPYWYPLNDTWAFHDDRWTSIVHGIPASATQSFRERGLPAGTRWSITVGGQTVSSIGPTLELRLLDGSYTYTVGTVANYSSVTHGTVLVDGLHASVLTIDFRSVLYAVAFVETGLKHGSYWQVSFGGSTVVSNGRTIRFEAVNGTYNFLIAATGYSASPSSGTIGVNGAAVATAVRFS